MWYDKSVSGSHRIRAALLLLACQACAGHETLLLEDANNYGFASELDLRSYELAAPGDPSIDWSALSADLQGHALDPVQDVLTLAVIVLAGLSEEEVEVGLARDSLLQSEVTLYVSGQPGSVTSMALSELTVMGNDIDVESYFVEGSGSWLVALSDSEVPGIGNRMAAFLRPSAASEEQRAELQDDSASLQLEVDLQSLVPAPAPADEPSLTLDWAALSQDGQGQPWTGKADQLLLARFDASLAELEAGFMDLELLADPLWTLDFGGGSSADLSQLADTSPPFTGIDDSGTWLLALICSGCTNPAPLFLTVLEVEG